jgi:putative PIN family toxin of toxin-antitoxin system
MIVILDTNIIISALIRDSATRRIIIESSLHLVYPEPAFEELLKHKDLILKKSGYTNETFDKVFNKLFEYITIIPPEIIKPTYSRASHIMKQIDPNDSIILATALAFKGSAIWSNDKDFKRQKLVRILVTEDLLKLFERM